MSEQEQEVLRIARQWRDAVLAEQQAHALYIEGPDIPYGREERQAAMDKLQVEFLKAEGRLEELHLALFNAIEALPKDAGAVKQ